MKRSALLLVVFALVAIQASSQINVYVSRGNLWEAYLTQNAETALLLFRDGELVLMTENLENRVAFVWDEVFKDQSPGDLLVVIHNHLGLCRWSEQDIRLYHRLRQAGFKGEFLLRLGSGKVIKLED